MSEMRILWVRDTFFKGDLAGAMTQARQITQVPACDWQVLMGLIDTLDHAEREDTSELYGILDNLVAKGRTPAPISSSKNIWMPIPD